VVPYFQVHLTGCDHRALLARFSSQTKQSCACFIGTCTLWYFHGRAHSPRVFCCFGLGKMVLGMFSMAPLLGTFIL
jgi:hypothetical protein